MRWFYNTSTEFIIMQDTTLKKDGKMLTLLELGDKESEIITIMNTFIAFM
jgi:hypothetical protein